MIENKKIDRTTVNEYFTWLTQTVDESTALHRIASEYLKSEQECCEKVVQSDPSAPFLTVITRTQGKRPDMLTETLLSLTGQSNKDFELLIMGHNLSDGQHNAVSQLISDLPDWMRERTRLIPVTGGTRTTPLNKGFEAAKGRYIVILDDDDLVFDHWVETFYQMSLKHNGKVLHAYTIFQDWETVGGDFLNTPRAAGSPDTKYCCDFELIGQLTLNKCPPGALAFPTRLFQEYGIQFDEKLTTTEDWDYLMRCAFLVGVADSKDITFLYRNWLNAENSASVHKEQEWLNNYKYLVKRFSEAPIVFTKGTLNFIFNNVLKDENNCLLTDAGDQTELFYDDGTGFNQESRWNRKVSKNKEFPFVYTTGNQVAKHIRAIRFDPLQYGSCSIEDPTIRVILENKSFVEYTMQNIKTNGYIMGDKIVFLKNDPQVLLEFEAPINIKEIQIACRINEHASDKEIDAVLAANAVGTANPEKKHSLVYRGLRKIYRIFKRIFRIRS